MAPAGEREFLDAKVTAAGVWDNFEGTFARINSRGQIIVMGTLLSGLDRSSRGVLLTPFHNMALMCPQTTPDDVARHHEIFAAALGELLA